MQLFARTTDLENELTKLQTELAELEAGDTREAEKRAERAQRRLLLRQRLDDLERQDARRQATEALAEAHTHRAAVREANEQAEQALREALQARLEAVNAFNLERQAIDRHRSLSRQAGDRPTEDTPAPDWLSHFDTTPLLAFWKEPTAHRLAVLLQDLEQARDRFGV